MSVVQTWSRFQLCDLHGLQHTRLPCPSPSPGACSNSCALSQWYHATISSSVAPFSSCLPSFPAWGSFPMSRFFPSGDQSIGASASASVLPMIIQCYFLLSLLGMISWALKGHTHTYTRNWKVKIHTLIICLSTPLVIHWTIHETAFPTTSANVNYFNYNTRLYRITERTSLPFSFAFFCFTLLSWIINDGWL